MNNGINIVSNKNSQIEKELRILNILRFTAVSMLITVALVSIIIFVISVQIPLSDLRQQENSTISQISKLHKKLATYYLIKDRVNNINTLMSTRKDYTKSLNPILAKISSDLTVDDLEVEADVITLTVSGNSLVSINVIINDLIASSDSKKYINNLIINSLNLNTSAGKYSVTFEASLL